MPSGDLHARGPAMKNKKGYLIDFFFFFLMDKIYFCKIGNFLTKIFSVMLRTLFPVISVFRLECVNGFLHKMFIALGLLDRSSHLKF